MSDDKSASETKWWSRQTYLYLAITNLTNKLINNQPNQQTDNQPTKPTNQPLSNQPTNQPTTKQPTNQLPNDLMERRGEQNPAQ